MNYSTILEELIKGKNLGESAMAEVMNELMIGQLTAAQIGALLTALRIKGESIDEITAAARIMRNHATVIQTGEEPVVDTCGTGGDRSNTFNVSTAAAFVAAGAGVSIAKHGNRSVSSKCGSADVLSELGVNLDIAPEKVAECIDSIGIGFLFAPKLHPAMKYAVGPRKELGIRTIFNMLGPLTNPARAKRQVLGVFDPALTSVFAYVLKNLGSRRVMVVHGMDRLDEITVTDKTQISELKDGEIKTFDFDPVPFIGKLHNKDQIIGGDASRNAHILREVLAGQQGPCADITLLNAAAAIYVSGRATDFSQAFQTARESISSGNASGKLESLISFTNQKSQI
jgi:anthranilate phosphoribosyltransferase